MTLAFGLSHLIFGVGAAHFANRRAANLVMLEWVGGLALVAGLSALGFGLARC